jgi:hypothetical protein
MLAATPVNDTGIVLAQRLRNLLSPFMWAALNISHGQALLA